MFLVIPGKVTSFSFIETQKQDYGLTEFLQLNQKFSTSNTNISTQKSNAIRMSRSEFLSFCIYFHVCLYVPGTAISVPEINSIKPELFLHTYQQNHRIIPSSPRQKSL